MHCPPPPPPTSAEERHYDAQANQHVSRESALATRNAGVLIKYKKHANAVKRRQVDQYAGGANLLVDLGCGRGGDINKWCSSNIGNVVAMDLSSLQLSEARRRADQDPSCRKGSTAITWLHASMLQPDLLEFLRPKLSELADAVTVQFAIQFAFGSEETASRVLGVASSLLRDGGTLFGRLSKLGSAPACRRRSHHRVVHETVVVVDGGSTGAVDDITAAVDARRLKQDHRALGREDLDDARSR